MNLKPFVDALRRELIDAVEAGGEEAQAVAERLTAPLESAVRLTLLEALSAAADEITHELAAGSVEVRLRGRDPFFVVAQAPAGPPFADLEAGRAASSEDASPPPPLADEGEMARINLRLPEALKLRVEEAARRERLSVNAWLVRAVAAAVAPAERDRDRDRGDGEDRLRPRGGDGSQRYTGWVR